MSYKEDRASGEIAYEIHDLGAPEAPILQESKLRIFVKVPKTGTQSPLIELVTKEGTDSYTLDTLGHDKSPAFREELRNFFEQSAKGLSARGLGGDVNRMWLHQGLYCAKGLNPI